MFEFHTDKKRYFQMQVENARNYVLPFIEEFAGRELTLNNGQSDTTIGQSDTLSRTK